MNKFLLKIKLLLIGSLIFITLHLEAQCWKSISVGRMHTVAINNDGSLWAWGDNEFGQLGINNFIDQDSPVQVESETNWSKISTGTGGFFTLGLKDDGSLWAWGRNFCGELGIGNFDDSPIPVKIELLDNVKTIAAGGCHALVIKTDGSLWAWGKNVTGQLGIGNNNYENSPLRVDSTNDWEFVTAGKDFSIATKTDGSLWAWGHNFYGQLGDGTFYDRHRPVQIGSETNWKIIDTGWNFTAAIRTDGSLWTWGSNLSQQLGLGLSDTINVNTPSQLGSLMVWESLSLGLGCISAIQADGSLFSWGYNLWGQLGLGSTTETPFPKIVNFANDWEFIDLNTAHSVGMRIDSTFWIWGRNENGELGDATKINRDSPIRLECTIVSNNALEENDINVYPNPFENKLLISGVFSRIELFNYKGQRLGVFKESYIDFTNLKKGLYIIKIHHKERHLGTYKIVKQDE